MKLCENNTWEGLEGNESLIHSHPARSVVKCNLCSIKRKNWIFKFFIIKNTSNLLDNSLSLSLQVFHCHFNSNFFPLFLDKLLGDSISPQTGSLLLGVSFVAPHINNLYFLALCRRFGVYSVIKWLFYVKLGLSMIMLACGPNWSILLCFYIARLVTESRYFPLGISRS